MTTKATGKDGADELTDAEREAAEFDAGWGEAAGETSSPAGRDEPGDNADAAGAKDGDGEGAEDKGDEGKKAGAEGGDGKAGDGDSQSPKSGDDADAGSGGSSASPGTKAEGDAGDAGSPSADSSGKETPPEQGAKGAADAGAGETEAGQPKGKQGSDKAQPEPDAVQRELEALREERAKFDRDSKAEIGRIRKLRQELEQQSRGASAGGATRAAPSTEIELPAEILEHTKKLRDLGDNDHADAIEAAHRASIATQREERRVEMEQLMRSTTHQSTELNEQAVARSRLDGLLPDMDWRMLVARDETGRFTHEAFRNYLAGQPYSEVAEFSSTEDPQVFANMVRSFEDHRKGGQPGKEASPSTQDAGAKQTGTEAKKDAATPAAQKSAAQNGDGTQTEQESAEAKRRAAQKEAAAGAGSGKATQQDERHDTDDFDAGWRTAANEEAAQRQQDRARTGPR